MIIKNGEWDYWLGMLVKDLKIPKAKHEKAQSIEFYDKAAWITPKQQGEATQVLNKDAEPHRQTVPTIGPRFGKSRTIVKLFSKPDAQGDILFTNAKSS